MCGDRAAYRIELLAMRAALLEKVRLQKEEQLAELIAKGNTAINAAAAAMGTRLQRATDAILQYATVGTGETDETDDAHGADAATGTTGVGEGLAGIEGKEGKRATESPVITQLETERLGEKNAAGRVLEELLLELEADTAEGLEARQMAGAAMAAAGHVEDIVYHEMSLTLALDFDYIFHLDAHNEQTVEEVGDKRSRRERRERIGRR
jgi:hypothetical protein